MKNKLFSIIAAASLSLGAAAQSVSVESFEALSSGETVSFYVHYADISGMTSTHFEMSLPSEFTVESVEATPAWTAMYSHEKGVVSGISTTANAFSGEGDITKMTVTIPEGTPTGTYPVTISSIRINGVNLGYEPTFDIVVVERHTLVLDENSTVEPASAEGVNVRVERTIKAGEWSTICLPFAMTEAQVKTAFGSDVQLGDFNDYDFDEDEGTITVKFDDDATSIEANRPYIIKVGQDMTEFTADGVDVDPQEAIVDFDTSRRKNQPRQMVGTYVAGTELDWGTLFLSGNRFWYSTGLTKMKAFRAYFNFYDLLPDFEDNYETRQIRLTFFDETTGIGDASCLSEKGGTSNAQVYDLQGRRVVKPAKGIYAKEGKKIVIK